MYVQRYTSQKIKINIINSCCIGFVFKGIVQIVMSCKNVKFLKLWEARKWLNHIKGMPEQEPEPEFLTSRSRNGSATQVTSCMIFESIKTGLKHTRLIGV
jgi:hypothetical protein